jgi:hypothetical protein
MDFKSLDHETRTWALVGCFLQGWALLENAINNAVGKALSLDALQTYIVTRNAQFTAKTHILRCALEFSALKDLKQRKSYDDEISDIQTYSYVRNMVAHDLFAESEKTDGVDFVVVKAKGALKFPDEDWSIARFQDEFKKVENWTASINRLTDALTPVSTHAQALGKALMSYPGPTGPTGPTGGIAGLGFLSLEPRLPLATPGSSQTETSPGKDDETPQGSGE